MSAKKPAADGKKTKMIVTNDPDDLKGALKTIGGSKSDHWNNLLANQAIQVLWIKRSAVERDHRGDGRHRPKGRAGREMAAQLIAAHNAAMECYRRAMIGEQSFEGRRENLSQANKLSRTYAALIDALNRHRGKGQQTVRVEHVTGQASGQAIVGNVETRGEGID